MQSLKYQDKTILKTHTDYILLLHPFNRLYPRQRGQAGTRKVNRSGFYWSERRLGGSGISWAICKSFAPRSRWIPCQYLTKSLKQCFKITKTAQ